MKTVKKYLEKTKMNHEPKKKNVSSQRKCDLVKKIKIGEPGNLNFVIALARNNHNVELVINQPGPIS
jgi:hypothetical protein